MTDFRHVVTDHRKNPARNTYNARMTQPLLKELPVETVNVTVRMARQTRDDAAKLFSELGISTQRSTCSSSKP